MKSKIFWIVVIANFAAFVGLTIWMSIGWNTGEFSFPSLVSSKTAPSHKSKMAKISSKQVVEHKAKKIEVRPFKRSMPKRKITPEYIGKISRITDQAELKKIAKQIQDGPKAQASDFKFNNKTQWNIYRSPKNNQQFHLLGQELKIHLQNVLVDAALKNDIKLMAQAAYTFIAVTMIDVFDYTGKKDKDGNTLLALSQERSYVRQQGSKKVIVKRIPASGIKALGYIAPETFGEVEKGVKKHKFSQSEEQAYQLSKQEQTIYNEQLPAHKARQKVYVEGDPLAKKMEDISTSFVDKVAHYLPDYVHVNPADLHQDNKVFISKLKKEANATYREKGDPTRISDVTDFEYKYLADKLIFKKSLLFAAAGGAFSSAANLMGAMASMLKSYRFLTNVAIITTAVGIETYFTAMGNYAGMKQLYVLHRYYSFMKGRKVAAQITGNDFDAVVSEGMFDGKKIYIEKEFFESARNAFLSGAFFGKFIHWLASKPHLEKGLFWLAERSFFTTTRISIVKKVYNVYLALLLDSNVGDFLRAYFPRAFNNLTNSSFALLRYIPKLPVFQAFLFVVDTAITSAAIFVAIYTRLYFASMVIGDVHFSPGANIQIAITGMGKQGPKDFIEKTRTFFYPLCAQAAHFSEKDLREKNRDEISGRQVACLALIKAFEGFSTNEEVEVNFAKIHARLTLQKPKLLSVEAVDELLSKSQNYPSEYKVVWLAALRSIYRMKYIPAYYWAIKNQVLLGHKYYFDDPWDIASFSWKHIADTFWLRPKILASYSNLSRLSYMTERYAMDLYALENGSKGRDDSKVPLNLRTYNGLISYVKINHDKTEKFMSAWKDVEKVMGGNNGIVAGAQNILAEGKWVMQRISDGTPINMLEQLATKELVQQKIKAPE
ncbi:MAG: hypothetical protein ISR65_13170 [Bacteriovoracaceae bacterium]|nr:hypothetical protein [Bacteriovoracaceae bacterium]